MGARQLGVLGGTFNPIHLGHLHIAQCARRLFGLDQIYFVVSTTPPHKPLQNMIPLIHRYAMVSLATAGHHSFIPSLIELELPASPFSVHTMEKLARRTSSEGANLYFIAGGDSLLDVSTWRESEKLLTSYNFIFVTRPGIGPIEPASVLPAKAVPRVRNLVGLGPRQRRRRIQTEVAAGGSRVYIVDLRALDISASKIRELASSGNRFRHLVSAPVYEYLQKTHLYGER